jgi:hypothetical protein
MSENCFVYKINLRKRGILSDYQGNQLIRDDWQDEQGPEEAEMSKKNK